MRLIGGMRFNAADGGALVYNFNPADDGASPRPASRETVSRETRNIGNGNSSSSRNRPRSPSPNRSGGNRPSLPRTPPARTPPARHPSIPTQPRPTPPPPRNPNRAKGKDKRKGKNRLEEEDLPTVHQQQRDAHYADQNDRPLADVVRALETSVGNKVSAGLDKFGLGPISHESASSAAGAAAGRKVFLKGAMAYGGALLAGAAFGPAGALAVGAGALLLNDTSGNVRSAVRVGMRGRGAVTRAAKSGILDIGVNAASAAVKAGNAQREVAAGEGRNFVPNVVAGVPAPTTSPNGDGGGNSTPASANPLRYVKVAGNAAQGAQTPNPAAINPNRWRLWRRRHHGILL